MLFECIERRSERQAAVDMNAVFMERASRVTRRIDWSA
jgi:hypothetical protein